MKNKLSSAAVGATVLFVEAITCVGLYLWTRSMFVCNILTFHSILCSWVRASLQGKIKTNSFSNWAYISSLVLVGLSIVYKDVLYLKFRFTILICAFIFLLIFYPIYDSKNRTFTQKCVFENFPALKAYFSTNQIGALDNRSKSFLTSILIINTILMLSHSSEVWMFFKTVLFPLMIVLFVLLELIASGFCSVMVRKMFNKFRKILKLPTI